MNVRTLNVAAGAVLAMVLVVGSPADVEAVPFTITSTLTGDIRRAWDASSAAAGALMLEAQARTQLKSLFQVPQLTQ